MSKTVARQTSPDTTKPCTDASGQMTARQWDNRFPGILDSLGIMAGAANVIMQLAHPGVGYGVVESRVESGRIFDHPIKRTRTTLTYIAVAMLGTPEEKAAYRKAVNHSHAQVRSTEESPVKYNAFDPELQLWVAACLYWGLADVQERFRGKPDPAKQEELYQLASALGTTLQVRPEMWPEDLQAFESYWQDGLSKLHLDDTVREFLLALADLKFLHPAIQRLFGPFNRFVTSGFLPAEMRDAMGLEWNESKQEKFDRLVSHIGAFNRRMPLAIRQAPYLLLMADFRRRLKKNKPLV